MTGHAPQARSSLGTCEAVVAPQRSTVAGGLTAVAAASLGVLAVFLGLDTGMTAWARVTACITGGLLAFTLAAGSWRLLRSRGGILVDEGRRWIGLCLTGFDDVWWLGVDEVEGVAICPPPSPDDAGPVMWGACLVRPHGPDVLLVETPDQELTEAAGEGVARALGLELVAYAPSADPPCNAAGAIQVARGVALQPMLGLLGASLTVVGGLLMPQVADHPIVAIFFAPVMMLLGAVLLGLVMVKRFAWEEIRHEDGSWTHTWGFGRLRFNERSVTAHAPAWRIHVQGMRGARLELVGDDGVLVIASGATTRSRVDVEALSRFPGRFSPESTSGAPHPGEPAGAPRDE